MDSYRVQDRLVGCQCGEDSGVACSWYGPASKTVAVLWVPPYLRGTAKAAGGDTITPYATRLRCERSCAERLSHVWVDGDETDEPDPWVAIEEAR